MPLVKLSSGHPFTRREQWSLFGCMLCAVALFILAALEAQGITLWR